MSFVCLILPASFIFGLELLSKSSIIKASNSGETLPEQSLAISVSNGTNQTDDGVIGTPNSNGNVRLRLSMSGDLTVGYHDLTIKTTNIINGYDLSLTTSTDDTKLVNSNNSNQYISATSNTKIAPGALQNNNWGYSVSLRNAVNAFSPTKYSQILPENTDNQADAQISYVDADSANNGDVTDAYRVAFAA